jgi:UDP-glucose:(heptosyl)LPS alpha-1,3-glucosyltransferase
MRIALGIVSLSEQGGLQRDCLGLADALRARGHEVEVFAARFAPPWSGARDVRLLPSRSFSNHGRDRGFARAFSDATRCGFDLVVGFNKLAGLDVYYCGDPCLAAQPAPAWKRILPRRRVRLALERACFDPASGTSALMLSPEVSTSYRDAWRTPEHRLLLLPPRIAPDRARPDLRNSAARGEARAARGYGEAEVVWLLVAAQPSLKRKGLDRILNTLPRHPDARLLVVGPSPDGLGTRPYIRLAEHLKVSDRVQWLGHRDDIPEIMAVADILVHPARLEVAGLVILEALANGLPVVASAVCGFAHHVQAAGAGIVTPEPFGEAAFDRALNLASDAAIRERWSVAARAYCREHDFARGHEAAAEVIERIGHQKIERS